MIQILQLQVLVLNFLKKACFYENSKLFLIYMLKLDIFQTHGFEIRVRV